MQTNDWEAKQLKKKSEFCRAAEILKGRIVTCKQTGEVQNNTALVWKFINSPEILREIAEGESKTFDVRDKEGFKNGIYQNYE